MPQCKAFRCLHQQGKVKKSFFRFPNPERSTEDRKTCQKWLDNLKNQTLPKKVDDYLWKRGHMVCEDHFAADSFEHLKGAYASELADSLNYLLRKRLRRDAVPTIVNNTDCTSSVSKASTCLAVRQQNGVTQNGPPSQTSELGSASPQEKRELEELASGSWEAKLTSAVPSTWTEAWSERDSPPENKSCAKEEDTVTSTAVPSTSAEAENGTKSPSKKRRRRKEKHTVQTPASTTDASAEPSERVNTPTAETSGVPWDLGCGHTAKTLQHFLHVTVAMGLDHAYSRHQAVSKALIASSGSGHILDVGLPPWLSTAIRNSEMMLRQTEADSGYGCNKADCSDPSWMMSVVNIEIDIAEEPLTSLKNVQAETNSVGEPPVPMITVKIETDTANEPSAPLATIKIGTDTLNETSCSLETIKVETDTSDEAQASLETIKIETDVAEEPQVSLETMKTETDFVEEPPVSLETMKIETDVAEEPPVSLETMKTETDFVEEPPVSLETVKIETDVAEEPPVSLETMKIETDIVEEPPVSLETVKIETDVAEEPPVSFETIKIEMDTPDESPISFEAMKIETDTPYEPPVSLEAMKIETDLAEEPPVSFRIVKVRNDIVEEQPISFKTVKIETDYAEEMAISFKTVKMEIDVAEDLPVFFVSEKDHHEPREDWPVDDNLTFSKVTAGAGKLYRATHHESMENQSKNKKFAKREESVRHEMLTVMHHGYLTSPTPQQLGITPDSKKHPSQKGVVDQAQHLKYLEHTPYLQFEHQKNQKNPVETGHVTNNNLTRSQPAVDGIVVQQFMPSAVISATSSTQQQPLLSAVTSAMPSSLDRPYMCQHCSAAFVQFSSLKIHMDSFHGEELQLVHGESSSFDTGVGNHGDRNDEGNTDKARQYVCTSAFTQENDLDRYERIHTAHKPLECDMCSQAFSQTVSLKSSESLHASHKSFVCGVCDKAFVKLSRSEAHRRSHIGHKVVNNVHSELFSD